VRRLDVLSRRRARLARTRFSSARSLLGAARVGPLWAATAARSPRSKLASIAAAPRCRRLRPGSGSRIDAVARSGRVGHWPVTDRRAAPAPATRPAGPRPNTPRDSPRARNKLQVATPRPSACMRPIPGAPAQPLGNQAERFRQDAPSRVVEASPRRWQRSAPDALSARCSACSRVSSVVRTSESDAGSQR